MNLFTPLNTSSFPGNKNEVFANSPLLKSASHFFQSRLAPIFLGFVVFILTATFQNPLNAQCDPCVPGMVNNGNTDPWSSECYFSNTCAEQGNPCQANDVRLSGVFIADSMGNPVGACTIGDSVSALLWGNFNNNTGTNRYAIRTNTEVWINGVCSVELNSCSFDVLAAGTSAAALVGAFKYVCGEQIQLMNTWIGWSTSAAQCSNPLGGNYNDVCGEYSPSKCSKTLLSIDFLAPNFDYACGEFTSTTTEVCFTDLTIGGTPPYTWAWDFGDGGMSTLQNPCHTYSATSGTFVVVLTVTDSNGTSAGAMLTIDLDSLACCDLTETCPPANGGFFGCINLIPAADTTLVTVTDSCGPYTITVQESSTGSGCKMDTFRLTRRYIINDGTNIDTCTQIFKATDNQPPTLICPNNVTVQCASQVPPFDQTLVTATDNCPGTATVTFEGDAISNQTCTNRFTVTRTYRASDVCGNSATCTQTITVFDNTAPNLSCPANVTVQCASQVPAPATGSVTSTDNCGGTATVTHVGDVTVNLTCANRFTVNRTYRSTDACGNSATCNQTITVFDNTGPGITCPPNVTVQCASQVPAPDIALVSATDNCGGSTTITHAGDVISGQTCTNRFTIIRTYQAVDACGNSGACNQFITVFDNTAPTLTCPPNVTVQCTNLVPSPAVGTVTSTDNCGGAATITHVGDAITNQTCANRYSLIRTYRATDVCGNSATCTQTISVFDNTVPTLTCPLNVTVQCANLVPAPNPALVSSTDNCGGTSTITHVGDVISNQTCTNRFNITRTYRAMDECGNSATCTQSITVFDNTVPFILCPANVTVQCASLVPAPAITTVTSSDNCGGAATVTHVGDVTSGQTCANRFIVTRTYRAMDECGNSATCTQTITVFDNTGPTITCPPNVTVQCANLVPAPNIALVSATDNCGGTATIAHLGDAISGQTCVNRFNITRTYSATDVCGNSSTCTQTITVFDNTAPTLTCPANVTVQCANQVPAPNTALVSSTDNCGGTATVTHVGDVISNQTCVNRFNITRTYRASDECGNSATCTQTITVFDNTAPTLTCPANVTVQCANLVPAPNTALVSSTDNCGGTATVTHVGDVISNQTCVNRFNITRTYRATDECGNSATCTQTITVFDNTAPTLTCPANVTVQCANLVPAPNTALVSSTDNCGGTATVTHVGDVISNQTCVNRFNITRTYRATDECGNSATCTQTITVFDNTPPSIICPQNVTVQCANAVPSPSITAVISTDNCGGATTVTHVGDVISNQTCTNRFNITRTYQSIDACGNSATCTQTITVFDNTPPALTCPANVTVQCANQVPGPNVALVTSTDNCGGTATVTHVGDVISNQTCVNRFNITRTYRATDECGNSATCTQTITVFDNTPPALTCPANVTVQCANQVPGPNVALVTSTDNCGGTATVTHVGDVISNQTCVNRFNVTRTYRATDECGNSATCTQTITVFDNTPPTLTCPANVTVQCASQVPVQNVEAVTTTDNCGGASVSFVGDVTVNQTCVNRFNVIRTYRATDECGNSATCTQTISVFDNTPPLLTCPTNVTVQCANLVPAPNTALVTSTDNCGGTATVTHVGDVISNQTCVNRFNVTRTYRATDECGNSATCTQTITVFDNTPPFIQCPGNVTVQCANQVPQPSTTAVISSDNCGGTATVTHVGDVISNQTCVNRFNITRTYRATDECGNSATCSQTITVFDNTPPFIQCPGNVTVQCANQVPQPSTTAVISSDNCGGTATVTHVGDVISNQTCVNRFNITRTYRATDECGNSATCTQTITVFDNTPPLLTCPANVTVQCANLVPAPNTALVTSTDNCGGTATVTHVGDVISNQTCVNRFNITRTYRATDECGNSATCTQTITVFDNTPPLLTCPANVTVQCANLVPAPNTALVTSTDNCGGTATVTHVGDVISNQTCVNRFNVTRTYRATDECGNSATCTQTITVFDNTPPLLTCPANVTVQCANLVPAPNPALVTSTDNCGGTATVTHVGDAISNQTCVNRFNITRTYRATDECGNSATCTQTITVFDNTPPLLTCPANVTVQCANLVPVPNTALVTSTDNCGGTATVTHVGDVISDQTCVNRFNVTRTYRATDECGNSATCTQTITVFDDTPPVLTCPANVTVQCANLVPAPNTALVTSTDNCGGTATVTHVGDVISNQTCVNRFNITRTYRATDECGNSATCNQTITVFDNTPPLLTCPANVTVQCASQVPAPNVQLVTSTDNCGGTATVTHVGDVISNQTCVNRFNVTRTYRATDECGNSATCTQTITVFDNTPPTLTCPANVTVQCASQVPGQNVESVTTTDNCGVASVSFDGDVTVNQTCVNRFTVIRTYRATDDCGNSATCTQTIQVFDNTAPTLTCPANVTVQCANLVPTPDPALVTATDNCAGTATTSFVNDAISNQTCANRFTVTRTYRATDECGNSATCTQTITVFDNTAPSLTCPANVTVQCANQVPTPNPALVTATDNCAGTATTSFVNDAISNQTCANRFIVTRTYRATDVCGNSATCTQTITVFDNTAPTLTCPANVTVQCANQVPPVNTAGVTSSDNCGGSASITHAGDVISNMTCVNRFIVTRTYRATDVCGNSATCTQTITVFDNTPPSITCPANVTVQCASLVPPVSTGSVTSSDNCGGTTSISHLGDVITNMTCANRFILRRTYRASDLCGNSATCVQTITVFDNTPPGITFTDPLLMGVPNGGTVEVQCFGQDPEWDLPTFGPGSVSATDNCTGTVTVTFTQVLQDEGNCPVDGYIVLYHLTWTATDVCGNSSTAHVFLALVDEIPPVIHGVPEDITVNCDEIPAPPTDVYATDECLCACVISYGQQGPFPGCQDGQVVTRSWTARDDCGNETVEIQLITLVDNKGPELIIQVPELEGLPDGSVLDYTCNEGGIPEFYDDLSAESVYSPPSCGTSGIITFDKKIDISNNCKFWGYIEQRTFHWHGVDQCGNETDLTIIARLVDTEPPVLINVPEMTCVDDPSLRDVDAIDNCGHPFIRYWDVEIPSPCGENADPAIMRTYETYDDCGNFARDTAILIPNDLSHPIMEFVNPILADLEFGEILIIDCAANDGQYTEFGPDDVTFIDDCMFGVTIEYTETVIETRDCSDSVVAVLELKWRATDICGNLGEVVIIAHVVDETSPEFVNFDPEVTIGCNDELPEISATDNCGDVTVTSMDSIIPGPCPYEYDILRKITATDPCGNATNALQTVHVGDGSGPIIEGVDEEVCDDLSMPEVTAYDPCAEEFVEVTMTEDTLDIECIDGFVVRRTWSATDICGNVATVVQDIIVGDHTPPVIQIPTYSIIRKYLDVPGSHLVFLSQTDLMELLNDLDDGSVYVVDDCDQQIIPLFTLEVTYSDNCDEDGWFEHRVYTWVATDACGNSSSISFYVDIMDDIPPVFNSVPADVTIICEGLPAPPIVQATDPAQPVTIEYVQVIEPGDGPGVFIVTRTWIATDACGNQSKVTQRILWIPDTFLDCDIILPDMVECNSHGVVIGSDVSGGLGAITYMWEVIGEKCFIQSGQGTPEITIYVGWSTIQINLTVTDAFGCSTVCSATLDCVDSALNPLTGLPAGNNETIVTPETANPPLSPDQTPTAALNRINLWPNPANGTVNLSFEANVNQEVQFSLINFLGQTILNDEIDATKGLNSRKIDVAKIPEGSYLLQVQSESGMYTKIITVIHQ